MINKLKISYRAWLCDKTACVLLSLSLLLSTLSTVINARVTVLITTAISEPLIVNLISLLIVLILNISVSFIAEKIYKLVNPHLYTILCDNFTDKILYADADMFTKFSCSSIITASGFIFDVCALGKILSKLAMSVIKIMVILTSIYIIGGKIAIPIIIVYIIGGIVLKHMCKKFDFYDSKFNVLKKSRNQEIDNIINGFVEVRSFNTVEYHRSSIHNGNKDAQKILYDRNSISCGINMIFNIINGIGIILITLYSIKMIGNGNMSQAQAMSLVIYIYGLIEPLYDIVNSLDGISSNIALAEEYDRIMSYHNSNYCRGNITLNEFKNEIRFNNVCFSYNSDLNVLNNINMVIKNGQKVGICGISGGGKTTLIKLINRLYHTTEGSITIDGIDIKDIDIKSYRRCFCSVHQDNIIFPGTIMENVKYGNFNASEYDVYEACIKANIYKFIIGLPNKFNTTVGPRGLKLSGGQKQRIALARLFLSNPDIILLDEATSALDNESESFIQDAIDSLNGKTIITIAHRLSTIRNSDIIYVIGNGGVIEAGTHDELMKKKGAYYAMNK